MKSTPTWYTVLDVSRSASSEDIKHSYRRLTLLRHPDAGGSSEAMRELLEAYRILSDTDLRHQYDLTLEVADDIPANEGSPNGYSDDSILPRHLLVREPSILYRNQRILARSTGRVVRHARCVVGIHVILSLPTHRFLIVLAYVGNPLGQLQPFHANDTVLLDQVGMQASGDSAPGDLWDERISKTWPSYVDLRAHAITRLAMYYPWDGFEFPTRWTARWPYFKEGYTSGSVQGYIDIDVPLKSLTQSVRKEVF